MMSRRSGWLSLSIFAVALVATLASVVFGWHERQIWMMTDVQLASLMAVLIGFLLLLVLAIASITCDMVRYKAGSGLAAECCVCGDELHATAEVCRGCGFDWHREADLDAEPTLFAGWPPRCRECGYDLSGLEEALLCPECGAVHERLMTVGEERDADWVVIDRALVRNAVCWLAVGSLTTTIPGVILVNTSFHFGLALVSVLHGVCVLVGWWRLCGVADGRRRRVDDADHAPWFVIDGLVVGWIVWVWIVGAWVRVLVAQV